MARVKQGKAPRSAAVPAAPPPSAEELAAAARVLMEGLTRSGGLAAVDDLMTGLRRHRLFADLVAFGTTLATQGIALSPRAVRLTAQGLIELGRCEEAASKLTEIIRLDLDPAEVLEAHGLMGRIHKQAYINDAVRQRRDAATLRASVDQYLTIFDNHPDHPAWHGINAAALLVRAAHDKVGGLPGQRAREIAGAIRETLISRYSETTSYFDLATIAEAALVLGELDEAELWFNRAAWSASADPFGLASTLRQLREVWLLDPTTPPGSRILPPLDARLHALGQTHMITPAAIANADTTVPLEKVFGTNPFMPFKVWAQGLECAKAVCRVEDKADQGIGTGFVVNGKLLSKALPDELLLITNAHVMTPKGDGNSLTPAQAHVSFYACTDKNDRPHTSKIKKILFTSPPNNLDVTIATLEKRPALKNPLSFAVNLPAADSKQKVFIIGHPKGGGLSYSLNDNELLDHGDPGNFRVHYRTPTEPGSSGSPVFNGLWELIALHHAGDALMQRIHGTGTYQANEGIAFKYIGPAIR